MSAFIGHVEDFLLVKMYRCGSTIRLPCSTRVEDRLIADGLAIDTGGYIDPTDAGIDAAKKIIHPRRKYIVTTHYGTEHVVIADSRNQARYMLSVSKESYLKMKARLA